MAVLNHKRLLTWFVTGSEALGQAFFGQGTGQIFLDNVVCTGDESTLISCPHITNHNCQHSEDAGVRCPDIPGNYSNLFNLCIIWYSYFYTE